MGMSAAGLWLAVIIGVSQFVRHSTGPPLKTIRRFHLTRHSLKQLPEASLSRPDATPESSTPNRTDDIKEAGRYKRYRRKRKEAALEFPLKARAGAPAKLVKPETNVDSTASGAPDDLSELFRRPVSAPPVAPPDGEHRPIHLGPAGNSNDFLKDGRGAEEPTPVPIVLTDEVNTLLNSIAEVSAPQDSTFDTSTRSAADSSPDPQTADLQPALTIESREPQPQPNPKGLRRDQFARKAGKLTYFLVDDEGRLVRQSRGGTREKRSGKTG